MKKIGIEEGLTNVADFLTNEGYSVKTLKGSTEENMSSLGDVDAIVTSGLSTDRTGYSNTKTRVPVISAQGLTPQEVKDIIDKRTNI